MSLLRLPNELLLLIAEELTPNAKDFKIFLSVNRRLYFLLLSRLHQLAADDKDGQPALNWAVKKGYTLLLSLLLSNGANPNYRETQTGLEKTALHCAAECANRAAAITMLLENGASPNLQDNNRRSALISAIMQGNFSAAWALLDYGADVNLQDSEGATALHYAIYATKKTSTDTELLIRSLVSKGAIFDHQDSNNVTPLYLAIARGHVSTVRLLLDCGADLLLQNYQGYAAIRRAVMNNDVELVGLLLEQQGVDVNYRDGNGKTILHWAASLTVRGETWDLEPMIRLLVSRGGDISIADDYGSMPFELVRCATENVRKLLEHRVVAVGGGGSCGRTKVWRHGVLLADRVR